ncbi:Uncharacterised protein [Mycobacteroides abscessus subsp. abscessus]|nr:Uncharacterised protein [Mycobacteroides abscessus subsp. abscessus]
MYQGLPVSTGPWSCGLTSTGVFGSCTWNGTSPGITNPNRSRA